MEAISKELKVILNRMESTRKSKVVDENDLEQVPDDVANRQPGDADPNCRRCDGRGWLSYDVGDDITHELFGKLHACECRKLSPAQQRARLEKWGIDSVLTFDNFIRERKGVVNAFEAARGWAKGLFLNLAIYGGTGNGKTHLATAAAIELIEREEQVKIFLVLDLMDDLKSMIGKPASEPQGLTPYDQLVQFLKDVPWLILDDFKTRFNSTFEADMLETIIVSRDRNAKFTMLTTNTAWQEMKEIAPRIYDRFMDKTKSLAILNGAGSFRGEK